MKTNHHTCSACGRVLPQHRKAKARTCSRNTCQLILRSLVKELRKERTQKRR